MSKHKGASRNKKNHARQSHPKGPDVRPPKPPSSAVVLSDRLNGAPAAVKPECVERTPPVPLSVRATRLKGRPAASCVVPPLPSKKLEEKVRELIAVQGTSPDEDLIEDIILTALRLVRDGVSRGELKIMAAALRELRYAFNIFQPFAGKRKVSIFGSARTHPNSPEYEQARRFSEEIVRRGYMVITGAGPGIMEAAQGGAGREYSFGMNIRLPFEQDANPVILGDKKLVQFRYFFTRKLCFVKEASAIALFPGGFGTHDEGFETLTLVQTGKASIIPIVFIDKPGGSYWREWADYVAEHLLGKGLISEEDMNLFKITDDADWAAEEIAAFYKRYHSSRFVNDTFVVRMSSPLSPAAIEGLNKKFSSMLVNGGKIAASAPLPEEVDQPELAHLPRLTMPFNRRNYGKLRQFVDAINRG